jgi:transposase
VETLIERCAGLDVHKDTVVACVRVKEPNGQRQVETRSFGTVPRELLELRDWLMGQEVSVVGMEATGESPSTTFWKTPWSAGC